MCAHTHTETTQTNLIHTHTHTHTHTPETAQGNLAQKEYYREGFGMLHTNIHTHTHTHTNHPNYPFTKRVLQRGFWKLWGGRNSPEVSLRCFRRTQEARREGSAKAAV